MAEEKKPRTLTQNRALHLLFTMLADELNEAGYDMKKTLNPAVDIPWTGQNVKEFLWRPIQKALLNKESTTELEKKEIDQVFDTLNRHLGQTIGIHCDFPSIETIMHNQRSNENS